MTLTSILKTARFSATTLQKHRIDLEVKVVENQTKDGDFTMKLIPQEYEISIQPTLDSQLLETQVTLVPFQQNPSFKLRKK